MARTHQLSPFNSPVRKRARVETYSPYDDDDFPTFSQEDLEAMDRIEAQLSQSSGPHSSSPTKNTELHPHDPDNPFVVAPAAPTAAISFKTGSALLASSMMQDKDDPTSSPDGEHPPEKDYSSWFDSAPPPTDAGFKIASGFVKSSFTSGSAAFSSPREDFSSNICMAPMMGFAKASGGGGVLVPSAAALAKAQAKLKIWQDSDETEVSAAQPEVSAPSSVSQFSRPVPSAPPPPNPATPSTPSEPRRSMPPPSTGPRAFKSPAPRNSGVSGFTTPQNPATRPQHPLSRPPVMAPPASFGSASTMTPVKPTSKGARPAAFVTPFKQGMKPGQPGHQSLQSSLKKAVTPAPKTPYSGYTSTPGASTSKVMLPTPKKKFFNTTMPSTGRTPLSACGMKPRSRITGELTAVSENLSALKQITPQTAMFFFFYSADGKSLGPSEALAHLRSVGCKDATQGWVDNHWSLILWKLAGMAALNPSQELDDVNRRWCWEEVLRQLLYRYEREINQGARPPLRSIAAQDKSPLSPLVLCISDLTWSEETDEEGARLPPRPHLEVTDGWYRLRASVDATLVRAAHKGLLRPGRKIGVMGANIISQRNEPSEILEAYDSLELQLHGNSCHLAPWHARLGFQARPWVSTLHKLSCDGGKISLMDLTVVKVHPIAFLESVLDEQGEKKTVGPRSQADENKVQDAWIAKRERLGESVRLKFTAELERYDGYVARLEAKGSKASDSGSVDSSRVEMLFDDLEDPKQASAAIQKCTPSVARALARFIRAENDRKREKASEELADELNASCPSRDVSNFRAVTVRDTVTERRPGNRVAHITIRDVLRIQLYDSSKPGEFKVGDRFMVTNVRPTQPKAWMGLEDGAEVWLSTISRSSAVVGLKKLPR